MHKLATFLIVVVLIARGAIFIYDRNKDKIDKLVTPSNTTTSESSTNTTPSASGTDETNKIKVSFTTLTFLLTDGNEVYYYVGPFNGTLNTINRDYIGTFIKAYKNNINPEDLMFIIKSGEGATLRQTIDLLDEMVKNEVPAGHYAETEMTKEEMDKIKLIKNK